MRTLSNHLPANASRDTVVVMICGEWTSLCELTNEMNPSHPIWRVGSLSPDVYHIDSKQVREPNQIYLLGACPYGIAEESWREISQKYPSLRIQCFQQTSPDEWEAHLFVGGKSIVDHACISHNPDPSSMAIMSCNEVVEHADPLVPSNHHQALMMRRPEENWVEKSNETSDAWAIPAPPWLTLPNQSVEAAMLDFIQTMRSLILSDSSDDVDKLCAARRIIDVSCALYSNGHSDAVDWLGKAIPKIIDLSVSSIFSAALASSTTQTAEVFSMAYARSGLTIADLFPLVELAYIGHRRPDNLSIILATTIWGYPPVDVESALGTEPIDSRLLAQIQKAAIEEEFDSTRVIHDDRESKRL